MSSHSETLASPQASPALPPAEGCLVCGRTIGEIGGKRLYAQQARGVLLDRELPSTGTRHPPVQVLRLDEHSTGYVITWGVLGSSELVAKARQTFLRGFHPWFCQCCGGRACKKCGAPLRQPHGSDHIDDDGKPAHCPALGFNAGCLNPDCTSL